MILVDTGFWLALANRGDQHHASARTASRQLVDRLATTWPVMTETTHLLANRLGHDAAITFIRSARAGAFDVHGVGADDLPRIEELMNQYRDLPMDLADASLVVVAERLGTGRILSTDRRDFGAYRWKNRRPFKNLLRV